MPFALADRVKETSTTTGTGNFTLAGAVAGFRTFNGAIATNTRTFYVIAHTTLNEWESGVGYISNATTFVREFVTTNSSGSTSKISFSAGTKTVFVTLPAQYRNNSVLFGPSISGSPESYASVAAWGFNNTVNGPGSAVFGVSSTVNTDSTAVGVDATASGQSSVAIGRLASATNTVATAVGASASASGNNATAVGANILANLTNQFCGTVRVDPSGVSGTYTLKYDQSLKEFYASSAGGGVTQIVAGTGISISPPTGTGVVTINATGGGGSFDWFKAEKTPIPSSFSAPTNYTPSPIGAGDAVFFGMDSINVFGGAWNSGNSQYFRAPLKYVGTFNWSSTPSPFSIGSGTWPNGIAASYVQYPVGHMMNAYYDVFGSSANWGSNFGNSIGPIFNPPPGGSYKLYGVYIIDSNIDISSSITLSGAYPAAQKQTVYDPTAFSTVLAVQLDNSAQVYTFLTGGPALASWPSSYVFYGHLWVEYT
jgi:hypothetical protein